MGWIRPYLIVLMVMAVWSIGSAADLFNSYLIPSPWKVCGTAWKLVVSGALFRHMAVSFYRVIIGFAITSGTEVTVTDKTTGFEFCEIFILRRPVGLPPGITENNE